jgi:hypothetical protein
MHIYQKGIKQFFSNIIHTTKNSKVEEKTLLSKVLSPEQQRSLITTTPERKVAVLSPAKMKT